MSYPIIKSGVYVLYSKGEVVYVGESDNIYVRVGVHIREKAKEFDSFDAYETPDRKALEGFLIHTFRPKYNTASGSNDWDRTANDEPAFMQETLQEAIDVYESNRETISVGRIANDFMASYYPVLEALARHRSVPVWKTSGNYWVVDYKWFLENREQVRGWVFNGE